MVYAKGLAGVGTLVELCNIGSETLRAFPLKKITRRTTGARGYKF